MYNITHINILMMSFGICISVAILLFLLTSGDRNSRLNRLFTRLIICNLASLAVSIVITVLGGTKWLFVNRIFVFLGFALTNFLIPLMADYICTLIARKTHISRIIPRAIFAYYFIWLISLIISQFNDMYYFFDENHQYVAGEFFWLVQVFSSISLPAITVIVLWYRKSLDKSDVLYLLFFPILSVIAFNIQIFVNEMLAVIYFSNTFFALFCYGGIQARQAKLLKDKELELLNARTNVMISQIQPHFLYNSLVVIRQLCKTDPKTAEETVVEFSEYLRGNMDSLSLKEPILFERELRHVEIYLKIEKKRFGNKLNVIFNIKTKDFMIPALTLQPIVENAVRYGITKKENGGTIEIKTEETDNGFIVTVTDDGAGFDQCKFNNGELKIQGDDRSHIGIENTRSRLAAMCSGTLEIQSTPGEGTTAVITIPK